MGRGCLALLCLGSQSCPGKFKKVISFFHHIKKGIPAMGFQHFQ